MFHSLKSPLFKGFENESFHLWNLQTRNDWVADEPLNYLERLFVRQRLWKRSAFQVSVFIRWNKAPSVRNKLAVWQWCTQWPVYCSPQLAPPIVLHTQRCWSCRLIFWHLLNKMFFTSCTTGASFTLGWLFIALTPTRHTPSPPVVLNVAEVRWNATPGSERAAALLSGSETRPESSRVKTHEWRRPTCTRPCTLP